MFIAGVLVLFGVQLHLLLARRRGSVVRSPATCRVILTIIWVVAVPNAVNLVDGLDGLAAGMVAIASAAFFVFLVSSLGRSATSRRRR